MKFDNLACASATGLKMRRCMAPLRGWDLCLSWRLKDLVWVWWSAYINHWSDARRLVELWGCFRAWCGHCYSGRVRRHAGCWPSLRNWIVLKRGGAKCCMWWQLINVQCRRPWRLNSSFALGDYPPGLNFSCRREVNGNSVSQSLRSREPRQRGTTALRSLIICTDMKIFRLQAVPGILP